MHQYRRPSREAGVPRVTIIAASVNCFDGKDPEATRMQPISCCKNGEHKIVVTAATCTVRGLQIIPFYVCACVRVCVCIIFPDMNHQHGCFVFAASSVLAGRQARTRAPKQGSRSPGQAVGSQTVSPPQALERFSSP